MGTSVNQSSPRTLPWQAAQATYRDEHLPVERVLQEVWRAATSQPEGDLASQIAQPIVSRLREIATQGKTAVEVASAVNREVAQSRQASLGVEIARRAAIQCMNAPDRAQAYSERVFAEASNYLLSRDLPGYVGIGRNHTVAESFQFKQAVMNAVTQAVRQVPIPKSQTANAWSKYTTSVINHLKRRVE